jgi:hypothetical protein
MSDNDFEQQNQAKYIHGKNGSAPASLQHLLLDASDILHNERISVTRSMDGSFISVMNCTEYPIAAN